MPEPVAKTEEKSKPFIKVYEDLLGFTYQDANDKAQHLSWATILVFGYIDYVCRKSGQFDESNSQIAKKLKNRISAHQASNIINELVKAGLITTKKGKANYRVCKLIAIAENCYSKEVPEVCQKTATPYSNKVLDPIAENCYLLKKEEEIKNKEEGVASLQQFSFIDSSSEKGNEDLSRDLTLSTIRESYTIVTLGMNYERNPAMNGILMLDEAFKHGPIEFLIELSHRYNESLKEADTKQIKKRMDIFKAVLETSTYLPQDTKENSHAHH